MTVKSWSVGDVLTASDMNSWTVPRFAYRTSNLARNSTTTPTADPQLQLAVDANAVYVLESQLFYGAGTSGDFTVQWTGTVALPSGAGGTWSGIGNGTTPISITSGLTTISNTNSSTGYLTRTEQTDMTASRTFGGTGISDIYSVHVRGLLRVSSTSGTIALNWCQGVSDATNTTLYADSWMMLRRVG